VIHQYHQIILMIEFYPLMIIYGWRPAHGEMWVAWSNRQTLPNCHIMLGWKSVVNFFLIQVGRVPPEITLYTESFVTAE